jgi:hypothetical protein
MVARTAARVAMLGANMMTVGLAGGL